MACCKTSSSNGASYLEYTYNIVEVCFSQLGHGDAIPDVLPNEQERSNDFLKAAHHVLMEVLYAILHDRHINVIANLF